MGGLLVTAAQLSANPEWRIFDCRHDLNDPTAGVTAYMQSHIPGALHLHLDKHLSAAKTGFNGRHPLPDAKTFTALVAALGIGKHTKVVAYDNQGGVYAARLWWMLRWIGHANACILDGGFAAWQKAGYPIVTEEPVFAPAEPWPCAPANDAVVDAMAILRNIKQAEFVVIDARSAERFAGRNETIDPVAGHIPGARNRFFQNNLVAETGLFKSPQALRAEFADVLENAAPKDVVHQCGSGVTACHNLFAMEIAGLSASRLYPGSWSEWCSDPSRPISSSEPDSP